MTTTAVVDCDFPAPRTASRCSFSVYHFCFLFGNTNELTDRLDSICLAALSEAEGLLLVIDFRSVIRLDVAQGERSGAQMEEICSG